ncbi:hypothetical protein B0J14DRAFT_707584 [Halenospora varia]|nr:hypothetical protein B0J14DRAFT_707584 [Halenospora varia]
MWYQNPALILIMTIAALPLTTTALPSAFNSCNRTDSIIPCPYGGGCEYPPLSCVGSTSIITQDCASAVCRRNCIDWGNGVTSTGLCAYPATTENGMKVFNPWSCDMRKEIYSTNCTSGYACQRSRTKAPPICSPVYKTCDANSTGCAAEGEICVNDPRRNAVYGIAKICISTSVQCKIGDGLGGDEGRKECDLYSDCVNGVCIRMIDCDNKAYGCPGTGFDYGKE